MLAWSKKLANMSSTKKNLEDMNLILESHDGIADKNVSQVALDILAHVWRFFCRFLISSNLRLVNKQLP